MILCTHGPPGALIQDVVGRTWTSVDRAADGVNEVENEKKKSGWRW